MTKAPESDTIRENDSGGLDMKRTKAIIITIVLIMAETLINQGLQNYPGGGIA